MTSSLDAWVPEEEGTDFDDAGRLAAAWLLEQPDGQPAVLVSSAMRRFGVASIDGFGDRFGRTTRRSRAHSQAAALAYVPDLEDLEYAMQVAGDRPMVAVEGFGTQLAGWAAYRGALDLSTGQVTTPLSDELHEAVDRLKFYGNNGYPRGFDRTQAEGVLAGLRSSGSLDAAVLRGALVAAGVSARGVANLLG